MVSGIIYDSKPVLQLIYWGVLRIILQYKVVCCFSTYRGITLNECQFYSPIELYINQYIKIKKLT